MTKLYRYLLLGAMSCLVPRVVSVTHEGAWGGPGKVLGGPGCDVVVDA